MAKTEFESEDECQQSIPKEGEAELAQAKKKTRFYCLSRDFRGHNSFALYELDSTDEESAWKEIEDGVETNVSQDWLITADEARTIRELLARIP